MMKNFAVCVFVLVFATFVQASEDCNSIEPDWKLPGTNCNIHPYFYKVVINENLEKTCECGEDYDNYSVSGSATEYFGSIGCNPCRDCIYTCKEPVYSCSGTTSECGWMTPSPCGDTHPRFWCVLCRDCGTSYDSCNSTGSWSDNLFSGAFSYTDTGSHGSYDWTENYSKSLDVTAVFDPDQVPKDPNCWNEPEVKYSKFDENVLVKAKNGDTCCEAGGSQTIRIYCSGASHIKNVSYTEDDGQLYTVHVESASDVDFCDDNNHSYPSIKVTYHPRHNKVEYQENLEETVEVSCDFYDRAGNGCGSGSVNITFTLGCPPPPGKG
jgi:hypothetical protein